MAQIPTYTLGAITCCRCSSDAMLPRLTAVLLADQVEQREKIDPYQVDKVPVQSDVLDGSVIVSTVETAVSRNRNPQIQPYADNHVQSVKSGHCPVKREVNRDVLRVYTGVGSFRKREVRAGKLMMCPVLVIL